mmetsp:Transcript_110366/g.246641  ORF Transcript_110366/g.246641 Transcript_110366/m.246641 type:complete len:223 (+) Transcript_110366:814-1482(+)
MLAQDGRRCTRLNNHFKLLETWQQSSHSNRSHCGPACAWHAPVGRATALVTGLHMHRVRRQRLRPAPTCIVNSHVLLLRLTFLSNCSGGVGDRGSGARNDIVIGAIVEINYLCLHRYHSCLLVLLLHRPLSGGTQHGSAIWLALPLQQARKRMHRVQVLQNILHNVGRVQHRPRGAAPVEAKFLKGPLGSRTGWLQSLCSGSHCLQELLERRALLQRHQELP